MKPLKSIVEKLSYSAVRMYFTSPALFWKHYVNYEPFTPSLTMLSGKAWHRGLEEYYRGNDSFGETGLEHFINGYDAILAATPKEKAEELGIKFKKEAELLEKNFTIYPETNRIWTPTDIIERKVTMPPPIPGGLPITGVIDILNTEKCPVDHKYIERANKKEEYDQYKVQAWFYYYLTKHEFGKPPEYFLISEYKKIPNRDRSPQLVEKKLKYEEGWMKKIDRFYIEVCEQILGQKHFMPNPFNIYDDGDWSEYLNSSNDNTGNDTASG